MKYPKMVDVAQGTIDDSKWMDCGCGLPWIRQTVRNVSEWDVLRMDIIYRPFQLHIVEEGICAYGKHILVECVVA